MATNSKFGKINNIFQNLKNLVTRVFAIFINFRLNHGHFCEKHRNWDDWVNKGAAEEAYNLRVLYGSDVYDSTRLHRTDARWFYVGVTHEYMTNAKKRVAIKRAADETGMIPKIFHDLSTSNPAHKKIRWSIDRDLLIEEWKRNPNRTRTAFYLAQSYECLNDYQNAFKW